MNESDTRCVTCSAPGNVFLLGEHSVVYERHAIISAIGLRTTVHITASHNNRIVIESKNYGSSVYSLRKLSSLKFANHNDYSNVLDPSLDLISSVYNEYNLTGGVVISISSEIPRSSGGMSSSTALLVSLLGALNEYFSLKIDVGKYFDLLYPFQVKIHGGAASGSELISSLYGGVHKIKIDKTAKLPVVEHEKITNVNFLLGLIDTNVEAKTSNTVPWIRNGWILDKDAYELVFDAIEAIVLKGVAALKGNQLERLGTLMTENQSLLACDLGISHPRINDILKHKDKDLIYGGKLSGGGGGGIIVCLLKSSNSYESISRSKMYLNNLLVTKSEKAGKITECN